ncbi:collagen-like protein [Corallococcus llansteffanensis]|uniref:Collagen-like protein n=1 Tax=Corallococcus llansteffanensis TaxID=2316731 RepID=A0A3A8P2W8_9BACT|nr:collagen-like protein [Corallococcus llansteffanensis]
MRGQGSTPGSSGGAGFSLDSDAFDAELDACLDLALFSGPARNTDTVPEVPATGSMRTLLDLASTEESWLQSLPPSSREDAEPALTLSAEAANVVIPEWLRAEESPSVAHALHDASCGAMTSWDAAPQANAWAAPGSPAEAYSPQPWMPYAPPEPEAPAPVIADVSTRILGMNPLSFVSAVAMGALAAGLLVVAGLRLTAGDDQRASTPQVAGAFAQGTVGVQGANAAQGTTGMQGFTASQGAAGTQGSTGPQGAAGTQGSTGPQGTAGMQGVTGPQGLTGVQGSTGPQGLTGAQGLTGVQGSAGATSPQVMLPGWQSQPGTTDFQQAIASAVGGVSTSALTEAQRAAQALTPNTPVLTGPANVGLTTGLRTLAPEAPRPTVTATMAKKAPVAPRATTLETTEDTGEVREMSFGSEISAEELAQARQAAAEAEAEEAAQPGSEFDEDFAREMGFTEEAEAERAQAEKQAQEKTVYVPPAPSAAEHERLSPSDVTNVVVTNQPAIATCVQNFKAGTALENGGRFQMRWSVDTSGSVSGVAMETEALRGSPLAGCIEDQVRTWKFPVHRVAMDAPVRFPFVF